MNLKKLAFEYFTYQLYYWYKENTVNIEDNDLSTLKVLKLLFFCTAIESDTNHQDTLIDSPFDNFYAMPYGHVESDIYNSIRQKDLLFFEIDNNGTQIKQGINFDFATLPESIKTKIDSSFSKLIALNKELFNMSALELVELSHIWYSWKFYYGKAKQKGYFSEKIPNDIIKSEEKILFIN